MKDKMELELVELKNSEIGVLLKNVVLLTLDLV